MKIVLGKVPDHGRNIEIDLDVLLKTRLLVQANSGGGKSWLLRRLAEQLFGKVPVIIIDPEGEFATLREKFGFVLVGKGGETPADPRSAAMVAHKLLELRASAVCDLFEMKRPDRHRWVRLFLEALIDAPKRLWLPTVTILDEAQDFCPEGKSGESEASGAVVDLAARGRKRQNCAVLATQRLGKLRKDATAELLNRLVGPTFEDVDLDRAADLLSVSSADKREFSAQMRVMPPGNFFGLGRAICLERTLVQVGPVETSHELAKAKFGAEPPPTPDKIKALLPKLADLPKAAEEKARTEEELRAEVARLKRELQCRPMAEVKPLEVPVFSEEQRKRLDSAHDFVSTLGADIRTLSEKASSLATELSTIRMEVARKLGQRSPSPGEGVRRRPAVSLAVEVHNSAAGSAHLQNMAIDGAQQKILDTVLMLGTRGLTPNRDMIARWLGIHPNGGRYGSNLAYLREHGYLDGCELTQAGRSQARPMHTGFDAACSAVDGTQAEILSALSNGEEHNRESLAAALGKHPNGGRYGSDLARLRTMGLIPERGPIKLTEAAFQ